MEYIVSKFALYIYFKFTDKIAYLVTEFVLYRTFQYFWLSTAEILLFKIVYIHNFSKVSAMDEYFLTNFVTFFNIVIIFVFTMIRICLREHLRTRFYHWKFADPFEVYRKVYFP